VEASLPANAGTSPSYATATSVSCASAGNCSAVGTYLDGSGLQQGLLLTESSGTWQQGLEAGLPAGGPPDILVARNPSSGSSPALAAFATNGSSVALPSLPADVTASGGTPVGSVVAVGSTRK
jgi:hypothetical protein